MQLECYDNNNNKIQVDPFIDEYGNIYIKVFESLYQVNIDKHNKLCVIKEKYPITKTIDIIKTENNLRNIITDEEYNGDEYDDDYYINNENYSDDIYETKFIITTNIDYIKIIEFEEENTCALYDIFIYIKNEPIFSSISRDGSSMYKIYIKDGNIYLKLVGYENDSMYKMIYNNDILEIKEV